MASTFCTTVDPGDSVLCTAAIEGDRIIKAELNLKLPGRGSKPVKTTIKEHYPWKLKQIQDAANYIKEACECLVEIQGGKQTCKNPENIEKPKKDPSQIRKGFEVLTSSLRRAESALVLPKPITAVQIYNGEQKGVLKPALPEDVVLHFHISSAMLVLTILTITQITKGQPTSAGSSAQVDSTGTYWVGTTFEHGSNTYEVAGQLQVHSVIPWVSSVLHLIQGMLELAQDFIDKVKVFEAMEFELD